MFMNVTKTQDKISVIIPVYNTAPYLKRCLDSVLGSTYRNLEVICVNDGSTDESLGILEHYQELEDRVVVINQSNSGVSAARNKGLARATGEFLSFVDSDDWVHPQMFELLRDAMDEDIIMAACAYKQVYQQEPIAQLDAVPPPVRKYPSLGEVYQKDCPIMLGCVWAHLYRAEIVIGMHFEKGISVMEDTLFNLMLSEKPGKCALVEESLYFYFQRAASAFHTAMWSTFFETIVRMFQLAKKEKDGSILQSVIYEYAMKRAFSVRYQFMFTKERNQAAKAARVCIREALNEMRRNRLISNKKIVVYMIMNYFPILYRIYRIANDPTLLDWEKEQKKLRA